MEATIIGNGAIVTLSETDLEIDNAKPAEHFLNIRSLIFKNAPSYDFLTISNEEKAEYTILSPPAWLGLGLLAFAIAVGPVSLFIWASVGKILQQWLSMRPGWTIIRTVQQMVTAGFNNNDPLLIAAELRQMTQDIPVCSFYRREKHLEYAFIDILQSRGIIQPIPPQ